MFGVVMLVLGLAGTAAHADTVSDVQVLAKIYAQKRADFTTYIEYVFFAAGCGVFKTDLPARQLSALHAQMLSLWMADNAIPQLGGEIRTMAETAGRKRAATPGQCDYWRRNPEESFRLQGEARAIPIF